MKSRTAEKTVEALMTRFNKNPQSLVFSRLADEYRKDGNYSKAIEVCINGLQNHPSYITGRIVLGMCYTEQGNHQAAIQEFLAAIVLDRKNQGAMKQLADLFNRQGNSQTAGELYHMLSKLDPGNRSLQIISKQFTFSGNTDIFSILGLPSPQTSFNFKAKEQPFTGNDDNTPFVEPSFHDAQTMALSEDGFSAPQATDDVQPVTSEEVDSRMDELFGLTDTASSATQQPDQPILQEPDPVESLSGEDIEDRMNALFNNEQPQEIIETVGAAANDQMPPFDSMEPLQPPYEDSINLTSENNKLSGDEVSDHIGSLFGDDSLEHSDQPIVPSLDIEDGSSPELLTGDDLQNHLEQLIPSENPQSDTIQTDFSDSVTGTSLSATSNDIGEDEKITGDDFADHLDSLTGSNDNLFMNADTSGDIQQDLLSISDEETADKSNDTVSGDDFASHMDSLLSTDDIQDDIQPDLQSTNSFSNVISLDNNELDLLSDEKRSGTDNDENSFMQDITPELQSSGESPDNGLILDTTIPDDTSIPFSSETISGQTGDSFFDNEPAVSPEEDTLTGEDFSNHMDMLLGDEDSADHSLYNKISSSFDTDISIPAQDADDGIVTGDDISDRLDSMTENLQNALIEEVEEQVSGNDISERIEALEKEPFLNIDQIGSDPDKNTPDISPFANTEFEETMQIDRSFIEKVQSTSDKDNTQDNDSENSTPYQSVNPFEFENETIQIDRSELFGNHTDSDKNDNEPLILDIENPTPNQDTLFVSDDIQIDQDKQSISEMDVLVEPSKDIQNVTGEDVIDKLDNIFTEDDNDREILSDEASVPENVFTDDASFSNGIDDITETVSWNETPHQDSEYTQSNDNVTGNDVEERLNELFNENSDSTSMDNQSYQESVEELEVSDEYQSPDGFMMSDSENSTDDNEPQEFSDNQENSYQIDASGMQSDFSANVNDEQLDEPDNIAPSGEIDSRDKMYSIPDHVLTPTLADIYYQQGQYQLALQIYSRLIEKDPSNLNLQERFDEIRAHLSSQQNQPGQFFDFGNDSGNGQEQSKGKKRSVETDKPLSGVRIKKSKKPKK
ncbi:MAG: tetratricopeptide repeat protein [Fibrobacter sp.]|nr:tetratricopeptide repeat protein [Fibrobacter sp.]